MGLGWMLEGRWEGEGLAITCWTVGQHPKVQRFLGGLGDESHNPWVLVFRVFIEVRLRPFLR